MVQLAALLVAADALVAPVPFPSAHRPHCRLASPLSQPRATALSALILQLAAARPPVLSRQALELRALQELACALRAVASLLVLAVRRVRSTCRTSSNRPSSAKCESTSARGNQGTRTGSHLPRAKSLPHRATYSSAATSAPYCSARVRERMALRLLLPAAQDRSARSNRARRPAIDLPAQHSPAVVSRWSIRVANSRTTLRPGRSCVVVPNLDALAQPWRLACPRASTMKSRIEEKTRETRSATEPF